MRCLAARLLLLADGARRRRLRRARLRHHRPGGGEGRRGRADLCRHLADGERRRGHLRAGALEGAGLRALRRLGAAGPRAGDADLSRAPAGRPAHRLPDRRCRAHRRRRGPSWPRSTPSLGAAAGRRAAALRLRARLQHQLRRGDLSPGADAARLRHAGARGALFLAVGGGRAALPLRPRQRLLRPRRAGAAARLLGREPTRSGSCWSGIRWARRWRSRRCGRWRWSGRRASSTSCNAVALLSPDVDVDLFRSEIAPLATMDIPWFIFVSSHDRALRAASFLRGQQARLGSLVDPAALAGLDVTVIDMSDVEGGDALEPLGGGGLAGDDLAGAGARPLRHDDPRRRTRPTSGWRRPPPTWCRA